MEYYSAMRKHKTKQNKKRKQKILLFITTWMKFRGIMLKEISQTRKDMESIVSLICGI